MIKETLEKKYRVIDMMLTMHATMRDRKLFAAKIYDGVLLLFSTLLVSSTFLDSKITTYFKLEDIVLEIIIGGASIVVFFFSILNFIINFKEDAGKYAKAYETLALLKSEIKNSLTKYETLTPEEIKNVFDKVDISLENMTKIPENKFLKLKKSHKRKIRISKIIDKYPSASLHLLKIKLFLKDNKMILFLKDE